MNLANKTFRNNKTGEIIRVIDSFENIAVLENKGKEDVRKLLDSNLYTEQIDPASFFNNQGAYNILAEKIKSIPQNHIKDEDGEAQVQVTGDGIRPMTNESAIVMSSEEDERAELARKYGVNLSNNDSVQRQNDAFAKLLGEESESELPKVQTSVQPQNTVKNQPVQQPVQNVIDPVTQMFKNVKRGVEFKMTLEISNKIPRIDFIEMMEDSYEISIIDFLATEFTNNLLQNPEKIKETIADRIKQVVYGGVKNENKIETKPVVDPAKVIKSEPQMISESFQKPKRKSSRKKETKEND
jgi:hypothetical protein